MKHQHNFKTISIAHTKDYNALIPSEQGGLEIGYVTDEWGDQHRWGKPITVFTQECTECHDLRNFTTDGHHSLIEEENE